VVAVSFSEYIGHFYMWPRLVDKLKSKFAHKKL
jgi:hypothetical protein